MLFFFACTPATLILGTDPDGSGADDSAWLEQIGAAAEDTAPEPEPDITRVFNLDAVHEVEITLSRDSEASLRRDGSVWVESDLTFDGETFSHTGVRIKGRLGSLRSMDQKCAWKVDVQQFGSSATLEGIQSFALGNMVQDGAFVHQVAAYAIYRAAGVPVPRLGYAWVTVNGEDFGLYILTEEYDDEFLDANYPDPSGNLYDGDYVMWDDGSYTLLDLYTDYVDLFELDEGAPDRSDLQRVIAALDAGDPLDSVVDTEQLARMWAVDSWIGHWDSYSYNWNNYRVYFDPTDGKAELLPWDLDQPFSEGTPITAPYGRLAQLCRADRACHARFLEIMASLGQTAADAGVPELTEQAIDLVNPYASRDPRREQSMETLRAYQQHLRDWLTYRQDTIDAMQDL